jgi:dihydroorotate dehydrogenase (NAD+) catalytic subunit
MVYQVAQAVGIPVIGLGGIAKLNDALEFLMAGASAIQVGTAVFADPSVLIRLIDELSDWMTVNGFNRVPEIVGIANPRFCARVEPGEIWPDEVAEG